MRSDTQNFEELIHLDNQPVAKGSLGDATEDLLNSNANEDAPPPTSPLHAFEENNTITQDNITTTQGDVFGPVNRQTDRHEWKHYLPTKYILVGLTFRWTILCLIPRRLFLFSEIMSSWCRELTHCWAVKQRLSHFLLSHVTRHVTHSRSTLRHLVAQQYTARPGGQQLQNTRWQYLLRAAEYKLRRLTPDGARVPFNIHACAQKENLKCESSCLFIRKRVSGTVSLHTVLNMEPCKQSTTCDCEELKQNHHQVASTLQMALSSAVTIASGRRQREWLWEQPAGRAEAQHADSTCNHSNNKHLNVSVSKTRATGGIRRGVLDIVLESVELGCYPTVGSGSRSVEVDHAKITWSGVESAMLNRRDNVTSD